MKSQILLIACGLLITPILRAQTDRYVTIPNAPPERRVINRGISANSKFSVELDLIVHQVTKTRGAKQVVYTREQLLMEFGIDTTASNPSIPVNITLSDSAPLTMVGLQVTFQIGNIVQANVRLGSLNELARDERVLRIEARHSFMPAAYHARPVSSMDLTAPPGPSLNRKGMTGKGVAVGIIDSGIDWRHPDFINADGTSRILAIYDVADNSFTTSGGKIGSKPPYVGPDGKPVGTVYTREQINAALKGTGTVKTTDYDGHGTACASVAAGNGRAAGARADAFKGVAPEADLIVVQDENAVTGPDHKVSHMIDPDTAKFATWIHQVAASHHEPVSINYSAGGQFGTRDGTTAFEMALDKLVGTGKPGISITVSAGNEASALLHAAARILPKPDTAQPVGKLMEIYLPEAEPGPRASFSVLEFVASSNDDWGLSISGTPNSALWKEGKPRNIQIRPPRAGSKDPDIRFSPPGAFSDEEKQALQEDAVALRTDGDKVTVLVALPRVEGEDAHYLAAPFGSGPKVSNGQVDLYMQGGGVFVRGAVHRGLVACPGTSSNVITVGAYVFRSSWTNNIGSTTDYAAEVGDIADYSSPGFRRDGVVKPEIAGPGSWALSALAANSDESRRLQGDGVFDTVEGGRYMAWEGTSASTPYVTGAIALMMQKNPSLDEEHIKKILEDTASHDDFTGRVPNPAWGYGKVDVGAALTAIPSGQ